MQKAYLRAAAAILLACGIKSALCAQDLERIVVSKAGAFSLSQYSFDDEQFVSAPSGAPIGSLNIFPVDLQSRQPKADIQTDFSLRGSNFQGVLMLLDGERINDPQTGHHNSDIPLTKEDIQRIDIIPGAGSSLFGPDSIGGAINFQVKRPQERKIVAEASGGNYGSWSGLVSLTEKINKLGVRVSVENQGSSGFRPDTDYKKFTSTFNSNLELPSGEYKLDFGYQKKQFGAYDFYTPGKGYESKEWTRTYLINTGLDLENSGLRIKPNFLWRRHFDKFMLDKTQLRSTYLNNHRTDVYTPNLYLQKELAPIGKLGFGLEYGQERIRSTGLGKHNRDHKSVFADDSKEILENLSLGASFRMDDFDGFEKVYTGSANLRYKVNKSGILRLAVSRNMRIPSFTELYYNDPTTVGDPGLSAEKSLNYEGGFDLKKEKLLWGNTLFLRREKDFIDWVKRTPAQAKWAAENISRSDVFGIEERLDWEINSRFNLNTNYSYVNRRMKKEGLLFKYGQNYSRHILNSQLVFKSPFGSQSVGFTYKKKPGRRGWFLLNTRLNLDLNKNAQIYLAATNLLNVEYQEIEGVPDPARCVDAGMRLEW